MQTFDEAFRAASGMLHALCIFRETCGDVTVLEYDGGLYACDHFVNPAHRLGTLGDSPLERLLSDPALERFGQRKRDTLPRCCRQCDVLPWCHGGCPKDRIATSAGGEPGLSYLCPAYQRFFRHVRPVLGRLVAHLRAGRAIGEFSIRLRGNPAPAARKPSPNEPCPCGSARKYKKCCFSRPGGDRSTTG